MNDTYYVYYATSKRVPDKKYPVQVIKGLAGRIDESGFHKLFKAFVETGHVVVRECGFTNFLLKFEDEYISRRKEPVKERKNLYRSMIVYLSNNSYLNEDRQTARKDDAVTNGSILRLFCMMVKKQDEELSSKPMKRFLRANEHDTNRIEKLLF